MGYNIGIVSLGCAKNQIDAEIMLGLLAGEGHKIVHTPQTADVIIVNTCGFIEPAKQESIDAILEMAEYKKGRCRALIVTGCLAERYNMQLLEEIPEVDALLGTGDYDKIADAVNKALIGERSAVFGHNERDVEEGLQRILTTPGYTAYLRIADGCDNRCTYCAIPMIRGRFRSRKMEDILAEAENLAERGVKELIVIAQDTTRYGVDLYGRYALDELLEKLCKIEKIEWIRVHYLYTEAITDGLIEVIANEKKICKYIDMPIQHANDEILKRMARRTNQAQIRERIKKIREKMPDCVIRTSIIVGFPGETAEQFDELCSFIKEIRFDRMGVFAYSQEEDTPAANFKDQVDEETKKKRLDELMIIQQKISSELNAKREGGVLEVITEGYDEDSYMYYGRSRGDSIGIDSRVYFAAHDEIDMGDIVLVKILDSDEYDLTGEIVDE
ncbi:MAG: 30S ribosomal protein S12 methylthiotransferase RimO [Clostridia bacterium]|nr:30S ribosomal protein S12 methylthiotransferase RimO [Clostridia bacterium]